ncbi:DUF4097 family beta strand repeat-containing protein [Streptomyces synnematoformans]|uniref:DUF4097 family beta strand repeat-containing protein n=1 Tax=Streptomyces synnematoformans TaxID=415721 RepID=A0ABN2YS84_9ACTN
MSVQLVADPQTLAFEEPVTALKVRIVNGAVHVVGTHDPAGAARLEVSEIEGPPLRVSLEDGELTVAYEDLPWRGFLKWLDRKGWRRRVVVSLAVPAAARVEVGVVGADAVVSGIAGRTDVRGVSGGATLVGLSGPVRADTVSGELEAQAVEGDLRYNSVSGPLTLIDGAGGSVQADTVSGDMVIDLSPAARAADVRVNTVSGEIALRLPEGPDVEVHASTTSGAVSNAFEALNVGGQWGAKSVDGRLGTGKGTLRATTVSGSLALLRRPPGVDEDPEDQEPGDAPPGGATGPRDATGPADRKVL